MRDFSLQLLDDEGRQITSKQYLERALADYVTQGDVSERVAAEVKEKNAVKQVLRRFFRERDCCTVFRPVVDEEHLQRLDEVPLRQLRQEFVDQITELKKSVLSNIRLKKIHGQVLDGRQWYELVNQCVNALNSGTMPNLQSSWTYIQRAKAREYYEQVCAGAFDQAIK